MTKSGSNSVPLGTRKAAPLQRKNQLPTPEQTREHTSTVSGKQGQSESREVDQSRSKFSQEKEASCATHSQPERPHSATETSTQKGLENAQVIALIDRLVEAQIRLFDKKKVYEDQNLEIDAFESLAGQFDLSPTPSTTTAASTNGTSDHGIPNLANITKHASSALQDKTNVPYSLNSSKARSLAGNVAPNEGTPVLTLPLDGDQEAYRAIIGALDKSREMKQKTIKEVREEAEKMANVLNDIWRTIIYSQTNGSADKNKDIASSGKSGALSPINGTSTTANTAASTLSAECETIPAGNSPQKSNLKSRSNCASDPSTNEPCSPTIAKPTRNLLDWVGHPTTSDSNGATVTGRRRSVLFDDEVGTSLTERSMIRRLEEKVIRLESRIGKVNVTELERENHKVCT
jgi:hypothetical protein